MLRHRDDLIGVLGDLAVRARELFHRRRRLTDRRGLLGEPEACCSVAERMSLEDWAKRVDDSCVCRTR